MSPYPIFELTAWIEGVPCSSNSLAADILRAWMYAPGTRPVAALKRRMKLRGPNF